MAELKDKCTFIVKQDQLTLTTQTNGDRIYCKGMHLEPEEAATLAHLIQCGNDLKIVIKEA